MTLGEKGVVYLANKESKPVHIPTEAVKAVDTTVSQSFNLYFTSVTNFFSLKLINDIIY